MKFYFGKKGLVWEIIISFAIAIVVLIIFLYVDFILKDRGISLLEFIGEKLKFGRFGK